MLIELCIRNIAVAKELDVRLGSRLTVLTGETGAGKSIVVDALLLALGGRASAEVIRPDSDRAEVTAVFSLAGLDAQLEWLRERDLDSGEDCVLRRIVQTEGQSRSYINGQPVPAKILRELGAQLVELQGQHEYHALLQGDAQRQLLDRFAGNDKLLAELARCYRNWQAAQQEYQSVKANLAEAEANIDLLRHQQMELAALDLGAQEWPELEQEHKKIANAQGLLDGCSELIASLEGQDRGNVASLLEQSAATLSKLALMDPSFAGAGDLLDSARIQVNEICRSVNHYLHHLETDPQRAAWVEQRITTAFHLARKYKVKPEELAGLQAGITQRLADSTGGEERLLELARLHDQYLAEYASVADRVSEIRRDAARRLQERVTKNLRELGMSNAIFHIALREKDQPQPSPHGREKPEFQISTNPGYEPGPLTQVASGGELSRVNLAIRTAALDKTRAPTMVFDEVDSGIGGAIAEVVGNQLRKLSEQGQILCITHLPQVAVKGHQHLLVQKSLRQGSNTTQVSHLDEQQRIEEIARMLGGVEITAQTRNHAAELLLEKN